MFSYYEVGRTGKTIVVKLICQKRKLWHRESGSLPQLTPLVLRQSLEARAVRP